MLLLQDVGMLAIPAELSVRLRSTAGQPHMQLKDDDDVVT